MRTEQPVSHPLYCTLRGVLLLILAYGLGLSPAAAQPTGPAADSARSVVHWPSSLQQRLSPAQMRRVRAAQRQTPTPSAIGGIPEVGPSQSWVVNPTPLPQRNFETLGTPQLAGDINGDGTNDYLYSTPLAAPARDERTAEVLGDRTGKTAVFYGGPPSSEPDQFFYTSLVPVGSLNGDGFDDAVGVNAADSTLRLYAGTPFGYQDLGAEFSLPLVPPGLVVRGFADLDDDGFGDVLLGSPAQDAFVVAYGALTPAGAAVETYTPGTLRASFQYSLADLGGAPGAEVVRLVGTAATGGVRVQVFEVGADRALTAVQDVTVEALGGAAAAYRAALVDVTGNGEPELAATPGADAPTYFLAQTSGGGAAFQETAIATAIDGALPVGDLDGDGRHDFYAYDDSTDTRYVAYGPQALTDGLSYDTEIPYAPGTYGTTTALPTGGLGDVTGDGRPDIALGLTDVSAPTVGRRFFSVNDDRTPRAPADVTIPRADVFDRLNQTEDIGDFNGDGTADVAFLRSDLGRVEVYFGGDSLADVPDLTLSRPTEVLYARSLTAGDVNGDGTSDVLVEYGGPPRTDVDGGGLRTEIYLGGDAPDAGSDHTIRAADVGVRLALPRVLGDVNGDGTADWMTSDRGLTPGSSGQTVSLFFGDTSLPTGPGESLQYPDGQFLGDVKAGVGDVNSDGIDDFAFDNPGANRLEVYFGTPEASFSRPADQTLPVPTFAGVAGGDFNGDGTPDIATLPCCTPGNARIEIFFGGPSFDATTDQRLPIPASVGGGDLDGDGLANVTLGALASPGDVNGDGAAELVHGSSFLGVSTHALLYAPAQGTAPRTAFRAPNERASLGPRQFFRPTALADVTGDGTTDFVAPQVADDNDAARSSRVYRYPVEVAAGSNVPPRARADTIAVPAGETITVEPPGVLGNDDDPNGDALAAALVSDVTQGILSLDSTGAFTYTPDAEAAGTDQFAYRALDGRGAADTTTATLQVQAPTCPVAWSLPLAATEASGDTLSVTLGQSPAATSGIDPACGEAEQPPKPPTGAFDLRFTGTDLPGVAIGQGLVRDLRPTDQATPAAESAPATWRLEVQSEDTPVTLSWTPDILAEALPQTPVRLVDAVTGGDLLAVDMTSTGSYTLDNASITALEVRLDRALTREVPVAEGWNLLSVPLAPAAPAFGAVLPMCESGFFFTPGAGYAAIDDSTAVPVGRGLFANCAADTTEITGPVADSSAIPVAQGWNIIGPGADSVGVGTIGTSPPGILTSSLFGFVSGEGYAVADTLTPGRGYWVKASQAGTLRPATTAATARGGIERAEPTDASYTRLRVTDATGRSASLLLAREASEALRMRHRLPPKPPASLFDVRFANGQSLAMGTEKDLHNVELQGATPPVSVQHRGLSPGQTLHIRSGGETHVLTPEKRSVTLRTDTRLAVGLSEGPASVTLEPIAPNPIRQAAMVAYALPTAADVQVAVFDVLGRQVSTLVDRQKSSGRHQVRLNATSLPSGMYFVRLQADNVQKTRRITVVH